MSGIVLHSCVDINNKIYADNIELFSQVGKVVTVAEYDGCWFIENEPAPPGLEELLDVLQIYDSCVDCYGFTYSLTDCDGNVIITQLPLNTYVGKHIRLNGSSICYKVSTSEPLDLTPGFEDRTVAGFCECLDIRKKNIPEYDSTLTDAVYCPYGTSVYKEAMSKKHGITFCCLGDLQKETIDYEILKINLLG